MQLLNAVFIFSLWRVRLFLQTGAGGVVQINLFCFSNSCPSGQTYNPSSMDCSSSWSLLSKAEVCHFSMQCKEQAGQIPWSKWERITVCASFKIYYRQPKMQPWQTNHCNADSLSWLCAFQKNKMGEMKYWGWVFKWRLNEETVELSWKLLFKQFMKNQLEKISLKKFESCSSLSCVKILILRAI